MMRYQGFTLLELLIAIAVSTILLTIGIPSFMRMVAENQRVGYTADFINALNLARSEAIKRNTQVILCKSAHAEKTSSTCSNSGTWADGWLVYANSSGDSVAPEPDSSDQRLDSHRALKGYRFTSSALPARIVYLPSGRTQNTGAFDLCPENSDIQGRSIQITSTGRPHASNHDCAAKP